MSRSLVVDVVIPTLRPSKVNPELLEFLENAEWTNKIIMETSRPLSFARKRGAEKASTEWIMMMDDDVDLPKGWWCTVSPHIGEADVLAISTEIRDRTVHDWAFRTLLSKFAPNYYSHNFDNHAYLVKRDVLLAWNPPPCFYCEDDLLFHFVKEKGRWLNLPCIGGNHWGFYTAKSRVPWGYYLRAFNLFLGSNYKYHTAYYLKFIAERIVISFFIPVYGGNLYSVFFQLRWCVQQLTGWIMAIMDGY